MFNKLRNNPKGWMVISLVLVALFAPPREDFIEGIFWLSVSVFVAVVIDTLLSLLKRRGLNFPSSATITGLIVGMVLDYHQSLWILVIAVAIAILSKHLLIWKRKHIFNPANFGLLVSSIFLRGIISWWAGVPMIPIVILGFFIALKMRRLSLVAVFLGLHLFFFGVSALLLHHQFVSQLAILNFYFAFFMLVEPKTSPITTRGRLIYGILTALLVFTFLSIIPQYDSHILALACINLLIPLVNKLV